MPTRVKSGSDNVELEATTTQQHPSGKALKSATKEAKLKSQTPAEIEGKDEDGGGRATTTRETSSSSRSAAAAFVAARRKMAAAPKAAQPKTVSTTVDKADEISTDDIHGAAKEGVVQVSDKKMKKPAEESVQAPAAAVAPQRPMAPQDRGPIKAPAKPAPTGKVPAFKTNEFIVYPAHGVGQIVAIEEQEVAGYKLELFVISFVKDKMILKVPLPKIVSVGMRKLAEPPVMKRALDTLTGRARVKRTMWSRRAQEYEAKINSGDLVAIAEVVRDLYRSDAQPEQSYSERQLYEAALDRMAREIAAVQRLTDTEALKLIDDQLQKGPRRAKTDEPEAEDEAEETEAGIGEAA